MLFVTGLLVGVALTSVAAQSSKSPNKGLVELKAATEMFKVRGVNIGEIRASDTKAILNNITDPNGIRIELAELPPDSMHRQAMNRW